MPSAGKVVTQGDVHEEIDLPCNLNVEDLKISAPLASTREHVLVYINTIVEDLFPTSILACVSFGETPKFFDCLVSLVGISNADVKKKLGRGFEGQWRWTLGQRRFDPGGRRRSQRARRRCQAPSGLPGVPVIPGVPGQGRWGLCALSNPALSDATYTDRQTDRQTEDRQTDRQRKPSNNRIRAHKYSAQIHRHKDTQAHGNTRRHSGSGHVC